MRGSHRLHGSFFIPLFGGAQGFGFAGLGGQQFGAGHGGTAELFPQGIGGAVQLLLLVDAGGIVTLLP